jgi:hypothetical protein
MPKVTRPDLAAGALSAVCVVGIVVLAVLHQPIPEVLTYLAVGALGVGGGAALPGAGTVPAAEPAAPASRALPAVPAPAPFADLSTEPATGVFRVARHTP